jgi:hypothetical protein
MPSTLQCLRTWRLTSRYVPSIIVPPPGSVVIFFQGWNESELCGVIVGTGAGKAFSAGGDVASSWAVLPTLDFPLPIRSSGVIEYAANDATRPQAVDFFQREYESATPPLNYC